MKDIQDKIKERRLELGLTLENVAEALGVNRSTVMRYESKSIEKMPVSVIPPLAKVLKCSPEYLMGWVDEDIELPIYQLNTIKLPLLGSVACGEPIYAEEDRESYVMAGTDIRADFCLKAQGDSMIGARIHDGDIIFVKKQEMVNDGEIAVVLVGEEATLKRFYYYKEQNMVILRAENPKYKDLVYTNEDINQIRVLGKAVAFQSDIK